MLKNSNTSKKPYNVIVGNSAIWVFGAPKSMFVGGF
jgi:hypothetical protein